MIWNLACRSIPNRFIGHDDLGPIFRLFCHGLQLLGNDFDCLVVFSLLHFPLASIILRTQSSFNTSKVSPMQRITPSPPSSAAFVFLAMNCTFMSSQPMNLNPLLLKLHSRCWSPVVFYNKAETHLVPFREDDSSFTMARQGPGNSAVFQLLCTDLACEGAIGLIKDVLGGDFDALTKSLSGSQEVNSWWSDYNLYWMLRVSPMIRNRAEGTQRGILD